MLVAAVAALSAPLAAPAQAADIIAPQSETAAAGWQAATCKTGTDLTCSPATKEQFFTQAAGHPGVGFTQFIVKNTPGPFGNETPIGNVRTLLVDLPPGLSVNPQATPQCELAAGQSPATCPPDTAVGTSLLTAALVVELVGGSSLTLPASPVYNLVPKQGQPARFGFSAAGNDVFLEPGVEWWGDYHEFFLINVPKLDLPEIPLLQGVRVLKNRLIFNGNVGLGVAGRGPFLTNPSTCFEPAPPNHQTYSTFLRADGYEPEFLAPQFPTGAQLLESPLPSGVKPTGCANVPFDPGVASAPNGTVTDAPFGPTVEVTVPYDPGAAIAHSNVRVARVSLPRGAGLNPAAAEGLQFCTDEQFGKGTTRPVACPPQSEIGTVAIQTPVLPPNSLSGKVFLGEQQGRDPGSGNVYRIFIDAESPRYGQSVRLVGNTIADPQTGQLTAVVKEAPQLPFTSVAVTFSGAKGVLTSPPTCGPNQTSGQMTPWSGTPDARPVDQGFALSKAPGGGPCAKTMAARPFSPGFQAAPGTDKVKTYTNFAARFNRPPGEQELKLVDVTLPPGATAKLKGVPYCKPGEIAEAEDRAGEAERKNPSCDKDSRVGIATVTAGTGPKPLKIEGDVYLAGRYKGAPLSLVVVTPAVAGPFDLGNVVVRVALNLGPETARINPVAIVPDVFGGAKLDIRSIFVNVNRKEFALTGTNCRKGAVAGTLGGGGADPTNPAAFSAFKVSDAARGTGCRKLKFKPRLQLRLFGKTVRNKNPKLRAALRARPGDANIRRASVALPSAVILDQANLANICTRPQYRANECPKKSIYGKARAFTPLLGKPLEGPVYLRSSDNTLPDLVAHLGGQVDIDLVGRIDSFQAGIRTTFDTVPDVPVTKFVLTLPGGKKGLLVNSDNLCKQPIRATVRIKAQNGRKFNRKPVVRTPCGK
ncbi:MAG: hypothetical protein QOE75_679 [Solirubrobacterales bacterium]|jgi:hypothetical protein|nr:hypothetical protein [Solirubrobacterales bacterium]